MSLQVISKYYTDTTKRLNHQHRDYVIQGMDGFYGLK